MTNFLKKNMSFIKIKNPPLFELLNPIIPQENLTIFLSKSGLPVPCVNNNDHDQCYHSRFDPEREGKKLFDSFKPGGLKIFLGLGGAYHIKPFLAESKILIIESSPEHLKALLSHIDYTSLLSSQNMTLLCRPLPGVLTQWLKDNYLPLLDGRLDMIPLRPQIRLKQEIYDNYAKEIKSALNQISTDCSTQKKLGRLWQRNIITNMTKSSLIPMKLPLRSSGNEAVLTAAGPSLSQHREYLSHLPDHVILMAVDTSFPVLQEWGIIPDYIITLDPQFIGYLHFMNPLCEESTVLADLGCSLPIHLAKVEWFASPHPLINYITKDNSPFITLKGGAGNVTQAGLEILMLSGIKKISILGADFSYPQGKPYAVGSYFYPWYRTKSKRGSPLENTLLQFVLKQPNLRKTGKGSNTLYTTERLETYKRELNNFVHSYHGKISNESKGLKEITNFASHGVTPTPRSFNSDNWQSYKNKLSRLKPMSCEPEWATLIPLAYSFYEENKLKASEIALEKALEYTLDLINKHI